MKYHQSITILSFTFFLLFSTSCAHQRPHVGLDQYKISPTAVRLKPGWVELMSFTFPFETDGWKLRCNGKDISYYAEGDQVRAYVSESYFSSLKPYHCRFKNEELKKDLRVAKVSIESYDFPKEYLKVPKRKVTLSPKDLKRVIAEKKMLKAIYEASHDRPYFTEKFEAPLSSYITSHYGVRRIFNNHKRSQHLGTDFRAKIGVPIHISNAGKVVFAGNLFFTGNAVIIDHGVGIFTVYGHLSEIIAKEGDVLSKKALIGKSGMTGRVSGPHLHWGVKVQGHWVNGFALTQAELNANRTNELSFNATTVQ